MKAINVYLGFSGRCREAMTFYQDCIGGELEFNTVRDSPMADQMPGLEDQILHSTLVKDGVTIMATDMTRSKPIDGNTFSICVQCSSEEEIHSFFDKLSQEGTVYDPLKEQFWGDIFGGLKDKFGKSWMFNYTKKQ